MRRTFEAAAPLPLARPRINSFEGAVWETVEEIEDRKRKVEIEDRKRNRGPNGVLTGS